MANEIKNQDVSKLLTEKTTELMTIVGDKLDYLTEHSDEFNEFMNEQADKEDERDVAIFGLIVTALWAGKFCAPDLYDEIAVLAEETVAQDKEDA